MTRTHTVRKAVLLGLLAGLLPLAAWAQFDQYTAPGGPAGRPEDRKGALEAASAAARWRLGPLRASPWIGVKNAEYVDNALGAPGHKPGDYTATVGAGLRAYLHSGPKLIWAAHALPEYVWWKDLSDRRRVNGRYGLGAFGFWNHLNLEATATLDQEQRVTTPELPVPVHSRAERAHLSLDAPIAGRLSVFGSGERTQFRSLVGHTSGAGSLESSLPLLDRDETIWRAGLRYNLPRHWSIGLGSESSRVDFVNPQVRLTAFADRSNTGTAPLVQIRHDSKEVFISLEAVRRSLSPTGGSSFVPFKSTTVDAQAGFNTARRLSYWLYGGRSLLYSLEAGYSYFTDDRLGASLVWEAGRRTKLRGFVEGGRDGYTAAQAGVADRRDDVRSFGASASFALARSYAAVLQILRSDYRSNLAGFDRAVTSVGFGVTFGGGGGWY